MQFLLQSGGERVLDRSTEETANVGRVVQLDGEAHAVQALDHVSGLPANRYETATADGEARRLRRVAAERRLRVDVLSPDLQILRNRGHAAGFYEAVSSRVTLLDDAVLRDRVLTRRLLIDGGVPVVSARAVTTVAEALDAFREIDGPVVLKSSSEDSDEEFVARVGSERSLTIAAGQALQDSEVLLVEPMIPGVDLQVSTIAGRVVGATLRVAANVVGNGVDSVRDLVAEKNHLRASNPYHRLMPINLTRRTDRFLGAQGLTLDTVPESGQRVFLSLHPQRSRGGDTVEVVDEVHPGILELAERVASLFSSAAPLRISLLLDRIDGSPEEQSCAVLTVRSYRDLRPHVYPMWGRPVHTSALLVDAHFNGRSRAAGASNGVDPRMVRRRPLRRVRPIRELENPHESIMALSTQPNSYREEATHGDPEASGPRALDQHHLAAAFGELGLHRVEFTGRLIRLRGDTTERILERSGGTRFVKELAADPDALTRFASDAGIATIERVVVGPDDLPEVERLVAERPGRWRLQPVTPAGKIRRTFHARRVSSLEGRWRKFPARTDRVIVSRVAKGPSCVFLFIGGRIQATILRAPIAVVGDGRSSIEVLIEEKKNARDRQPYGRLVPIRQTLLENPALARKGLDLDEVPLEGEVVELTRSPRPDDGVDTYGLDVGSYPRLARIANRLISALEAPALVSVSFVLSSGNHADSSRWVLHELDPDPVLSEFAFPAAGQTAHVFGAAAQEINRQEGYTIIGDNQASLY